MATNHIFNFVEGGVLQRSLDENGQETEGAVTFDMDNLECGQCPVCMEDEMDEDETGHLTCPDCGFTDEDDDLDMIKKFLAWVNRDTYDWRITKEDI